jgi:hypothetical protein
MSATRKIVLKYLGLGAVAVPFAGLGFVAATGPGALERQREAARRDGLPLLPEDLKRASPVPEEQNAAPFLRELVRLWKSKPEKERNAWDRAAYNFDRKPEERTHRASFEAIVGDYPDCLRLAEAAAERPHCDFAYDWGRLPNVATYSNRDVVRRFARFFALRARLATTPEMAFADIARAARLGRLLFETPTMMHAYGGNLAQKCAHASYLVALRRFGASPSASRALEAFGTLPDPEFYLRGDVVATMALLSCIRAGKTWEGSDDETEFSAQWGEGSAWKEFTQLAPILGAHWEERLILRWRETFQILRATRGDFVRRGKLLEERGRRWDTDRAGIPQNVIALIVGPIYDQSSGLQAPTTLRALREAVLSLMETKAKMGAFPKAPELPFDPYSGKPLRYRREGAGCVLWSVGPDRKDDGGVALSADKRVLDLVVRL